MPSAERKSVPPEEKASDVNAPETATESSEARTALSEELLGSDGTLVILHDGERYVLRRTRNGRLILTK